MVATKDVETDSSPAMVKTRLREPKLGDKATVEFGIASNGSLGLFLLAESDKRSIGWLRLGMNNDVIRDIRIIGHRISACVDFVSSTFFFRDGRRNCHFSVRWELKDESAPLVSNGIQVFGLPILMEHAVSGGNKRKKTTGDDIKVEDSGEETV